MKNQNGTSMIHCSFDTVTGFVPRVPKQRIEGIFMEDNKTKRICVAPTILQALQAIPQSGMVMETMRDLELPIIIHAYYLKGRFYSPTKEQVPDVDVTGEQWLLQKPDSVYRRDYEVTDFFTQKLKDQNGKIKLFLLGAQLKRVAHQENGLNFARKYKLDEKAVSNVILSVTFRTLMANCGDELIKILKEKGNATEN